MIEGRRVQYEPVLSSDPDSPEGHERFPYARFRPDNHGEYVEPDNMGYSDYSGSTVDRSNVRVFMEAFEEHQGVEWWLLYGGHGTEAIVVRRDADERVPEIGEFFDGLANYPLADESDHSELEMELQEEAWKDFGLSDFKRWLQSDDLDIPALFPRNAGLVLAEMPDETQLFVFETLLGIELEDLDDADSELNDIVWEGVRNGHGDEIRHEDAVNVYFDYKRIVQSYLRAKVDQGAVAVAFDWLLDHGGQWGGTAEKLLTAARRDR